MFSSFNRTLQEVKSGDGSLSRILASSQNMTINAPQLLLSNSLPDLSNLGSIKSSAKKKQTRGYDPKLVSMGLVRRTNRVGTSGDRYIPCRKAMNMEQASFYLTAATCVSDPSKLPKPKERILKFSQERPAIPDKNEDDAPKAKKSVRYIPDRPEKMLDAPNINNDFYLNYMDWSGGNILAVALDQEVYLWNALEGTVSLLMTAGLNEEYITSVKFSSQDSNIVAIGTSMGRVQLWDVRAGALQRTMILDENSPGRVPALSWCQHIVSSGSRLGEIRHHDVRIMDHVIGYANNHDQEICGLQWSPDFRFLASGANDNLVCIYNANRTFQLQGVQPDHILNKHEAAIKAIGWCPWKPTLLATGGGTADHHIRFWNAFSGVCVRDVDVTTQVSGLIWNEEYREIITSHGDGVLRIWKYPNINLVKTLAEHEDRVLSICASPDGEMIASIGGDENVRIWHCFEVDKMAKRLEREKHASMFTFPQNFR
nr:cell division cycle protein 20 [Hymenolepis microstoma]